ncbi:MAG: hypothetical protein HY690_04980 [Chloroflexi bacterium]|nr:hypothetical protein [Chloroflexota bacterium]
MPNPKSKTQNPKSVSVWLALALLLAALAIAPTAHGQSQGVVEGRVANGTAGAGPAAGARVTLYAARDQAKVAEQSQEVDAQGRFRFEGLDADPGLVYVLVAEYQGVVYPHLQLLRLSEQPSVTVEPRVYETTQDARDIAFERVTMLVGSVDATEALVMEMGTISNAGDRTYVGDDQGVLRLHAPAGATDLEAQAGLFDDDVQPDGDGLVTRRPVPPGSQQLVVRYSVPIRGSAVDLSKRLDYTVGSFILLVPEGGLQASSPQLLQEGGAPQELGGGRFLVYSGQNLAAGSQLAIRLSGLPSTAGGTPVEQRAATLLLGGLLLAAGVFVLAKVLRGGRGWGLDRVGGWRLEVGASRSSQSSSNLEPPTSNPLDQERVRLVAELAELDDRFACGDLPEEEYRQQRGERKQRLLVVAGQLRSEVEEG